MKKTSIHFAHANGFPAKTYNKLFSILKKDYQLGYIDKIGHDPNYPVTQNWDYLVQELVSSIEQQHTQPVVGVGHSLGGVLTYFAAVRRPELFSSVILLDSPVFGGMKSHLIRLAKRLKLIDKITPAANTKNRRQYWENPQQALLHFQKKKIYARFDDDVLNDYIKYGTVSHDSGVKLLFDRQIEYQIYRTIPHNFPKYNKQMHVPAGLLYGQYSYVIKKRDACMMNRRYGLQTAQVQGGHLFPMEHPAHSAQAIKSMLINLK